MPSKKTLSPTQRTLRELRSQGIIADICEKWNPYAGPHGSRHDLFGILDLIALAPPDTIGIQCCAVSGLSEHRKKLYESELTPEWLRSGNKLEIWAWGKYKLKRGGKAMRWKAKVEEITIEDFLHV